MTSRRVVVDHVLLVVKDLGISRSFYTPALRPLGITTLYEQPDCVAYGVEGADDFAICQGRPSEPTSTAAHVAFVADDRRAVDAFYEAALVAGGRSKHAPDLHPEYHAGYYAAFVYDPDGNNIEAVHHGPH